MGAPSGEGSASGVLDNDAENTGVPGATGSAGGVSGTDGAGGEDGEDEGGGGDGEDGGPPAANPVTMLGVPSRPLGSGVLLDFGAGLGMDDWEEDTGQPGGATGRGGGGGRREGGGGIQSSTISSILTADLPISII